jgi:uncharacterized protein
VSEPLKSKLEDELNRARKARDRLRTTVMSSTLAELKNKEIETRRPADDEMVREVLARAVKQRNEAASQMREAGREELASREEEEASILGEFLPPPLAEAEVREMVRELAAAGPSQMGAVMGALMPRIRGRFDGREASRIVREEMES